MPDLFSRLRNIVWTAVGAVVVGVTSAITALAGVEGLLPQSLAFLGLTLAVLSTRQ